MYYNMQYAKYVERATSHRHSHSANFNSTTQQHTEASLDVHNTQFGALSSVMEVFRQFPSSEVARASILALWNL